MESKRLCLSMPARTRLLVPSKYGRVVWRAPTFPYHHTYHYCLVNSIAWAPHEFGLMLASTSSDGSVTVLTYNPTGEEPWAEQKFQVLFSLCG